MALELRFFLAELCRLDFCCLGYLLSAEKSYPTKSFLIIVKQTGSDPDAFKRPTGLTLIWSTRFHDASNQSQGHFYKPVAPTGYVALGDVAIHRKKGVAVTVADFPRLVCVKQEFVDKYAEQLQQSSGSTGDIYSKRVQSLVQPHIMIWNTKKLPNCNVHMQLWTQPPFSNEVESPFFLCNKLDKPSNVYPRLNIRYVLQDDPQNITVFADWMTKKGKGVASKAQKRFFILTSEKKLYYYETEECRNLKGVVDLRQMDNLCRVSQKNTEKFEIPTKDRKWEFSCDSSQDSIKWVNKINEVSRNPKGVVEKIIAVQIQGQPREEDDYKDNDDADDDIGSNGRRRKSQQKKVNKLFDAPMQEQVTRLLLQNINIIKKILKNDHGDIYRSRLDTAFDSNPNNQEQQQKSSRHNSARKKRSSSAIRFPPILQGNSSNSKENHVIVSQDSINEEATSDELMLQQNANKQSIYKHFDDAWSAVKLLLRYYSDKTPPIEVQKYVDAIPKLQEESIKYIMKQITNYVKTQANASQPDPIKFVEMCDACALVETFDQGRQTVVADITSNLLKEIREKYAPGTEVAGCKFVKQRFEHYQKQIEEYERVYSFFIPAKWLVPVTLSLQFCQLTGQQIDEHLTKNPENSQFVLQAKEICMEYEEKLRVEAQKFLARPNTELDKEEQAHNLPQYDGMISSILDQHLNSYITVERSKAQECVLSAKNETFSVLSEDGSLTEMYEAGASKTTSQKYKSCELLLVAIRQGFKKCITISRGQQLVDLLLAHQQFLNEYNDILLELMREALETNGVISITSKTRKAPTVQASKLTERYLWFEGYYEQKEEEEETKGNSTDNKPAKSVQRRDRDAVIQQVLTFLVLCFNSSMFCKESMLNLGKAAHKAIEPKALKIKVNFQPLYQQFESLQFAVSERLSQCIMCRIVQDLDATYKSMKFDAMNEKDYIYLEKCRYQFESAWSSLAIQLLYIMPIAHYKLMIKRCVYLIVEYLFESTLRLNNVNNKIARLLMDNYAHIKSSMIQHLANESQHLASEIETACKISFQPTDALYDLLCTPNEAIPAFEEDKSKAAMSGAGGFDIYSSIKTKLTLAVDGPDEAEPIFYKKYTPFEMKVVEFYHSSNAVLCFQTLLLQLVENQIKVNRASNTNVKPHFFDAFDFSSYVRPQQPEKLTLKERLIYKVMECKSIDKETQKKIMELYRSKKCHDMKQEQEDSISEALAKKQEWEKQQKQRKLSARKESSGIAFFARTPTDEHIGIDHSEIDTNDSNSNTKTSISEPNNPMGTADEEEREEEEEGHFSDDDIIVMKQAVDIRDVDNKIVFAPESSPELEPEPEIQGEANQTDTNRGAETQAVSNTNDAGNNSTNPFGVQPQAEDTNKASTTNPFENATEMSKAKLPPPKLPPPKVPPKGPPPKSRPPPIPMAPSPAVKPPLPVQKPPPLPLQKPPPVNTTQVASNNNNTWFANKWFATDDKK